MIKYNLDDEDINEMCDKLKDVLNFKYKDELQGVDEFFVTTLIQNYVLQLKNNDPDFERTLENLTI